tara:strand:- start:519 stop:626 length:108 start_codon:yes stop_codon:yes gene_type:complete
MGADNSVSSKRWRRQGLVAHLPGGFLQFRKTAFFL